MTEQQHITFPKQCRHCGTDLSAYRRDTIICLSCSKRGYEKRRCPGCGCDMTDEHRRRRLCPRCKLKDEAAKQRERKLQVDLEDLRQVQANRCGICGEPLPTDPAAVHVDHITPVSKGGTSEFDNLQLTHAICNQRKHDKETFPNRHQKREKSP